MHIFSSGNYILEFLFFSSLIVSMHISSMQVRPVKEELTFLLSSSIGFHEVTRRSWLIINAPCHLFSYPPGILFHAYITLSFSRTFLLKVSESLLQSGHRKACNIPSSVMYHLQEPLQWMHWFVVLRFGLNRQGLCGFG